mgnify:CR=1 FL=1|jgi:hypothetical protein
MNWLAQLSFTQALRWALLWPAFILCLAVTAVAFMVATRWSGDWAYAVNIDSRGPIPLWLAVTAALCAVLIGPSLLFLALWRVARR